MLHKLLKPYIKFLSIVKDRFDEDIMLIIIVAISTLLKINVIAIIGNLVWHISCSDGWTLLITINAIAISLTLYPIEISALTDMVERYRNN